MSEHTKRFYEFGPFRLDAAGRRLMRNGAQVPLKPKTFDTLLVFVQKSGEVLEKNQLMELLWPDSVVEENNLNQSISALRKALGERPEEHRYIKTIPGRGYRFVAVVRELEDSRDLGLVVEKPQGPSVTVKAELEAEAKPLATGKEATAGPDANGRKRLVVPVLTACLAAVGVAVVTYSFWGKSAVAPATTIRSIAVLPLKSLNRQAGDDYLGLGIADTIITKISQAGGLTVRPTSAVRKYADQEIDSLSAGRQLQTDSVLDGTFLHSGDRLRVTVNLLRVQDGASLWAESFDMSFTDIFAIQDQVSREVAERLRLKLNAAAHARLAKRYTSNPTAYSYYTKAVYNFSNRRWSNESRAESDRAVEFFKRAIELDPGYALARAQLGYAYVWTATNFENNASLVERAKQELNAAERLDPELAEIHIARSFIVYSQYEGWQVEAAVRELRRARQYDPNIGHFELADIYVHIGLDEEYDKEMALALEVDPDSSIIKQTWVNGYYLRALPDEGAAAERRLFNRGPDGWYYLEKKMLKEAEPLIAQSYQKEPGNVWARRHWALLLALQGKHQKAEAAVPGILERAHEAYRAYHHLTYEIARIYALGGKSVEAVKWLKETAREGNPNYPLFLRDSFLDPIRKDPAFIDFMAEMKTRWEGYRREFG